MEFHKASGEKLKNELAATITGTTRLRQLVKYISAEEVDLRQRLCAVDCAIRPIIESWCLLFWLLFRAVVENFRAGLVELVNDAFRAGFTGYQLHSCAAIDGSALRFLESIAPNNGDGSIKGEDVVDPSADSDFIEFYLVILFRPSLVICFSCLISLDHLSLQK